MRDIFFLCVLSAHDKIHTGIRWNFPIVSPLPVMSSIEAYSENHISYWFAYTTETVDWHYSYLTFD